MPTNTNDARFLGVNYRSLWSDLHQAWVDFQNSAFLSWFTPEPMVALYSPDGVISCWQGGLRLGKAVQLPKKHVTALELPEDLILRRVIRLPALSEADVFNAARLHAQAVSPFAENDLVWGLHTRESQAGSLEAHLVLASRKQVSAFLQSQAQRPYFKAKAELWAMDANGLPVVLHGYGEVVRQAQTGRMRMVTVGLFALAAALVAAMAITPTLQLRARALKAASAYEGLVQRAAPQVKEREQFMQSVEKLNNLNEVLVGRIEPLRVLERLTQVMPDDSALQSFSLKEQKVTLTGLTGNASVLMRVLGEQAGIRDVRAPSAAIRVGGDSSKENFVIEFSLDAAEFGLQAAAVTAEAQSAATTANAAAAAAVSGGAVVAPSATVQAPAAADAVSDAIYGPLLKLGVQGASGQPAAAPSFGGAVNRTAAPTVKSATPAASAPMGKGGK